MDKYTEFFSSVFLFASLPAEKLASAILECEPELRKFSRSEMIYAPGNYEKEIGFILSGECEIIRRKNDGSELVLNNLKIGDSFGILAVLSDEEEFPTVIFARQNTEVLFIKKCTTFILVLMKNAFSPIDGICKTVPKWSFIFAIFF